MKYRGNAMRATSRQPWDIKPFETPFQSFSIVYCFEYNLRETHCNCLVVMPLRGYKDWRIRSARLPCKIQNSQHELKKGLLTLGNCNGGSQHVTTKGSVCQLLQQNNFRQSTNSLQVFSTRLCNHFGFNPKSPTNLWAHLCDHLTCSNEQQWHNSFQAK